MGHNVEPNCTLYGRAAETSETFVSALRALETVEKPLQAVQWVFRKRLHSLCFASSANRTASPCV